MKSFGMLVYGYLFMIWVYFHLCLLSSVELMCNCDKRLLKGRPKCPTFHNLRSSFIRCNPPAMLGQICAVLPSHIDLNELMYSTGVRMSQTWSHNPYIEKQNDTLSCLHLALTSFLRFSHLVCCFDGVKLALVY